LTDSSSLSMSVSSSQGLTSSVTID
jgi:hypothetical protein